MTKTPFILCAVALAMASCGGPKELAVVENVVAHTKVGDVGSLMVNAIEITVSNPKSLTGLTAADFDFVNNAPDGFVDTLIEEGKVDGSKLFCAGASSGGGCTMRFMMQFPDRFKAAIPCCAMDPIVPIHQVKEKYEGQFTDDIVKAFQDKVYKWNGEDMVLADIDTKAFCDLPMYFVHADSDTTCKVISSHAYYGARQRLGATNDLIQIYDDAYMQKFGIPTMISHFSWVPLLNDYSEGTAMNWLVKQM